MPHQLDDIIDILTELDQNRVARFSYTETAFNNDEIDGVASFNAANEQNIPLDSLTDYEPLVLDKGLRAQGASIPRMAMNHFLGRLSFNVNKFVQRMLVAVGLMRTKLAQDANKYDADLTYQQGDICFVVSVSGTVTTVSYYVCLAADTVGITPGSNPSYWRPISVDLANNKSFVTTQSLIPVYSLVDLTGGSFSTSNWYPVVSSAAAAPNLTNGLGITNAVIDVYGEHTSGKAQLIVETSIGGAPNFDYDVVKANRAINSGGTLLSDANNPIGYSRLVLGRQRVVWLKGGARYMIYNTAGLTFSAHTTAYDNGQDAPVSPGAARVFSPVYQRVHMKAVVPTTLVDDEAPNYAQLAALANIAITGDNSRGTTLITDADAPLKSGFYSTTPPYTNNPEAAKYLIYHSMDDGTDAEATQIAIRVSDFKIFGRVKVGGTWGAWKKIWNEDNDGPGSGLDADLLDGQHGSYYQNADNLNAGAVPLARIPATLTGKDADTLDGQHATAFDPISIGNAAEGSLPSTSGIVTVPNIAVGELWYRNIKAYFEQTDRQLNFPATGAYETLIYRVGYEEISPTELRPTLHRLWSYRVYSGNTQLMLPKANVSGNANSYEIAIKRIS